MDISQVQKLGALSLINYGRKHAEKAAAHPDPAVAGRAGVVSAAVTDLELGYAARRPLTALWSRAADEKDERNEDLDGYIGRISYDLLSPALLKGDRDATVYRVILPDGNIRFIYGPDRAEIAQALGMATYLDAHPEHPMADRAATLREKALAFQAALQPVADAEAALRKAQEIERERRAALLRVVRKSVRFLRDVFDGDEAKVEALFPTIAEARVKEDEPPAE